MAKSAFITRSKKTAGKFAVRFDDGTEMDELDEIAFEDGLDDLLARQGYAKSSRAPGPVISRLAARLSKGFVIGGAAARLSRLISETARELRLTEPHAKDLVLASPEGKEIWELERLEELEAGKHLPSGWYGRSNT